MPKVKAGAIHINYETFGDGPPLLLIMGFAMPGVAWMPMLPFLNGFKCYYFDNRGTGYSDKPDGLYSVPAMADDASALMRAIGLEQASVYGISMGGMIAQELALLHPEQVTKLVLGCTMAGGPTAIRAANEVVQTLIDGSRLMATNAGAGLDLIIPLLFPPDFTAAHPEIKQFMLAGMQLAPPTPATTADRAIAGIMQFDTAERLHVIECPVLIVHGDKDILVPPGNAALIKEKIPQAEVFMIPGAGHNFAAADPVGICRYITDWLKQ
ncbi:MAG TPA: alpha/beta hydrolase [Candidatus Binataceae bacterium]|nr:alpha/beta hydrolase [Candidatus Binataceae bacterium]